MTWLEVSRRRCGDALRAATASADRCVLLRQWTWLHENRVDVATSELDGLNIEVLRGRFGVIATEIPGGGQTRLTLATEIGRSSWPQGLTDALRLETNPRRRIRPCVGDGSQRRLTEHPGYLIPTQKAALRNLVTAPPGSGLLVTMPTGSGKSLLFQFAAKWAEETLEGRPCLVVIVPTVSLAQAHCQALRKLPGLENATALTGDLRASRQEILLAFQRGDIPILLMNPETAMGSARAALSAVSQPMEGRVGETKGRLVLFVIDEAHIVQSWGRSFRPDFQALPSLLSELRRGDPELRLMLLSATVDDRALGLLQAGYGHLLHVAAEMPRYELQLVRQRYGDGAERDRVLSDIIDRLPRPAVIYTTTIEATNDWATELRRRGYGRIGKMTGDTAAGQRKLLVEQWMDDELDIVVATSAFGMGIDKADVRAVIHACLPEDAARYYQEVGRAGRDGYSAVGICLWTDGDKQLARRLATSDWLLPETAAERWVRILELGRKGGKLRQEPETGNWVLEVALDSAPVRLGAHTGETNRGWNRSLMLMLERASAIDLLEVRARDEVWVVRLRDQRLLSGDIPPLLGLFQVRQTEKDRASSAFDDFVAVLQAENECMLQAVFELVEAGSPASRACGRCVTCLEFEESPVDDLELVFGGPETRFSEPLTGRFAAALDGTLFIQTGQLDLSATGLCDTLVRMAELGCVQFVVPKRFSDLAAGSLEALLGNPGLLLTLSDVDPDAAGVHWPLLDVPTCVVLDDGTPSSSLIEFLLAQGGRRRPLVIIGRARQELRGRPLAPLFDHIYDADYLEHLP